MKIQDLQDGDLIFTVGSSEIAAAIRAATGSYSHVTIFFNGEIYHATHENGVVNQDLSDFLQDEDVYDVYCYPAIDADTVFKRAKSHLGKPYNFSFYPQSDGFYCSEYIAEILPIFDTISMQFGDEGNQIFLIAKLHGNRIKNRQNLRNILRTVKTIGLRIEAEIVWLS